MNKNYKYSIIIALGLLFTGCDFINGVHWKDGNYEISNDPVMPDCKSLYYTHHGRVSCVSKIGSNEKYIIVQSNEPNRKYWFINKAKDDYLLNDFEIVEGPYDLQTFNKLKIKKGIANLNFEEEF